MIKSSDIKNQPYLLFLSRVDPKKGPDLLLKAFAKYCEIDKNHILIIWGKAIPLKFWTRIVAYRYQHRNHLNRWFK